LDNKDQLTVFKYLLNTSLKSLSVFAADTLLYAVTLTFDLTLIFDL